MKFLSIFFILFALNVQSQDLIITQENDTIHCKINAVMEGNIYYTIKSETKLTHASIAEVDVLGYQKSNSSPLSTTKHNKTSASNIAAEIFKDPRVRLGFNLLYAKRVAPLPKDLSSGIEEHYKQIMQGVGYSADLVVFVTEDNGVGVDYSKTSFSASTDNVYIDSAGVIIHGPAKLTDEVEIMAFTPMFYHRFITPNPRNVFIAKFGVTFLGFQQVTKLDDLNVRVWGNTVGIVLGGEYSYRVDPNFSLGIGLNYETGIVSSYSVDDGTTVRTYNSVDAEYAEDLQRIVVSVKGLIYF